jgi:hypothetical protein
MNRDDIIRMAHEADCLDEQHYGEVWVDKLTNFAELVAAAERKACAKVCEDISADIPLKDTGGWYAIDCAVAIRAKGAGEQ